MITIGRVSKGKNRLIIYLPKDSKLKHRDEVAIIPLRNLLYDLEDVIKQRLTSNDLSD